MGHPITVAGVGWGYTMLFEFTWAGTRPCFGRGMVTLGCVAQRRRLFLPPILHIPLHLPQDSCTCQERLRIEAKQEVYGCLIGLGAELAILTGHVKVACSPPRSAYMDMPFVLHVFLLQPRADGVCIKIPVSPLC